MNALQTAANFFVPIWTILAPLAIPGVLYLGYMGVAEMQRRGWSTTYATAILRAAGAGFALAQAKGLDPFSAAGRTVVAAGGAVYLKSQVGDIAAKLGIPDAEHAVKVLAQLDAIQLQAQADAKATAETTATASGTLASILATVQASVQASIPPGAAEAAQASMFGAPGATLPGMSPQP